MEQDGARHIDFSGKFEREILRIFQDQRFTLVTLKLDCIKPKYVTTH
jgi:hypothetical protein